MMNWPQLISNKRLGQEHKHSERHDDRTEFKRDYDRLIFSAPFLPKPLTPVRSATLPLMTAAAICHIVSSPKMHAIKPASAPTAAQAPHSSILMNSTTSAVISIINHIVGVIVISLSSPEEFAPPCLHLPYILQDRP